jgi:hypothetical protein
VDESLVDLALLQSVSYIAGALGVCVAAVYYVMTLRVQQKNMRETILNRRAAFAVNMLQSTSTEEGQLRLNEVLEMQWTNFEDWMKKYDSSTNPQLAAKRGALWSTFNFTGLMYKSGVIDLDSLSTISQWVILLTWLKFKPVIEAYRGQQLPKDAYSEWEYLADVLMKKVGERDFEFMSIVNRRTN